MFSFSTAELVVILAVALVVFGPGRLPEIGKAIGNGINNFKSALHTTEDKPKSSDQ